MFKKITKEGLFECLVFVLAFLLYTTYNLANNDLGYDRIWTFHMTQKIAMGEIPYSEINIIITPLFYQLGALLFNITGQANLAMYSVYGGLICGFVILMTYKLIKEFSSNSNISFFASCIISKFLCILCETNYNSLLLGLILTVVYLELQREKKKEKSTKYNIIIGFVLGLGAAVKHNVGGVIIIASLILPIIKKCVYKEKNVSFKEIGYKLIGICVIGLIYLIWLISVGALESFIDFALLGMFDFAEKNSIGGYTNLLTLLSAAIIYTTFLLDSTLKNKENEKNNIWLIMGVYALAGVTYIIPLCNPWHSILGSMLSIILLFCFCTKGCSKNNRKAMLCIMVAFWLVNVMINFTIGEIDEEITEVTRWDRFYEIYSVFNFIAISLIIGMIIFNKLKIGGIIAFLVMILAPIATNTYVWRTNVKENDMYYISEYSCIGLSNEEMKDILEVNDYILKKENEGYKVLIMDIEASRYMVPLHKNNYKYDLMLNGNLGFKGEKRLIEETKQIEKLIVLRQKPEVETIPIQQPEKIDEFIEDYYVRIGEINDLEIYGMVE